jgi:hypothetical protein
MRGSISDLGQSGVRPLGLDSSHSIKGKEKDETGSLGGSGLRRLSREESRLSGLSSRRDSSSIEEGPRLRDRSIQLGGHRGQFGLKLFEGGGGPVQRFGERFTKERHEGLQIGPYRVVGEKSRGVEPGFIGKKAWTDGDTAKMSEDGHKFSAKADTWLRQNLNPLGGSFQLRKMAGEILTSMDIGFRPGKDDPYRFMRSDPEVERAVLHRLKQKDVVKNKLVDHIMSSEPKFTKNHYVKLDYRETERSGTGPDKTYTLPKSNAKSFGFGAIGKFFHQLARRQTPDNINRDAMRESLANDLMKSFGIFAQKLKLVPTTYRDGTPKLLLDGTHMTGPNGEKFSDFEGAIKGKSPNGQLVKLDPKTKEPLKNERGHYEVDTSIQGMGRNKIFMLALGDRDAIGSSGGNKGRVGNIFAAIDPGHSLELGGQRLMEKHDIHSDMSFDQPSRLAGKCYKNFTIFDQSPFSERMEGVRKLQELRESGEDLQVFDDYAREFNKDKQPGMDFEDQINSMKGAYEQRRDYILDDVFKERLGVYDYDMSGVGDANAQETAKKQTLDVLDTLEKITSKHSWMSGNTELEYPTVSKRTEWNVKESGDNVEFSVARPSRDARRQLESFMAERGLDQGQYDIRRQQDGSLVLSVPKTELGTAFRDFSVQNLRAHDEARTQRVMDALEEAGF